MDNRKNSEEIKQRIIRHNRLMKMIHGYRKTLEEEKKLQKIKANTMMEINIRYKFPFMQEESEDQQNEDNDPSLAKKENIVYDLSSQNALKPNRSPSKRTISLQSSRRVVSLELQRNQWQRQKLLRLDLKAKHNHSSKMLSKKNSFSEKPRAGGSRIRLPELKIERYRENLKTQTRSPDDEKELESVISKKLITQSCQGRKKMNGVEKYLQKIETKVVKNKFQRYRVNS